MPTKLDNKPINNSHRGLRVTITPADIKRGKRRQPDSCAAAGALCKMQGVRGAKVYRHCVYLQDASGEWQRKQSSAVATGSNVRYTTSAEVEWPGVIPSILVAV